MSELHFYIPVEDIRRSPSGCPGLIEIATPYVPVKPWELPLSEQPKGRLHKSERNMARVIGAVQSEEGTGKTVIRTVQKEPFGRNGLQEPVTIVRFK